MIIRKMFNKLTRKYWYEMIADQKELEELECGLQWSYGEGCAIDDELNRDIQRDLEMWIKE